MTLMFCVKFVNVFQIVEVIVLVDDFVKSEVLILDVLVIVNGVLLLLVLIE